MRITLVAQPGKLKPGIFKILDEMDRSHFPKSEGYPKEGSYWWLAYDGSKPVGYCGATFHEDYNSLFLCRAAVNESHRGMGLQRRMIAARERLAEKIGVPRVNTYTSHDNVHSSNNLIRCGYMLYVPPFAWGVDHALYWQKFI